MHSCGFVWRSAEWCENELLKSHANYYDWLDMYDTSGC